MKSKRTIFLVLTAAPPAAVVCLVLAFGLNVPYWDDWAFVTVLEKFDSGTLRFEDFWDLHNEHRLLFPRLVMFVLARASDWDVRYPSYASIATAGLTLVLLCRLLRRSSAKGPPWLVAAFSALVFSLGQWENWTWGWTIQIYMSVCATVAAVWAVWRYPRGPGGIVLGSVLATVACYSFSNGLVTWVVLMALALQQRRPARQIVLLAAAFVVVTAFYFYGYQRPPQHPGMVEFLKHPYDSARFVLAYLGSPLSLRKSPSVIMGLLFVGTTAVMLARIRRRSAAEFAGLAPWSALALYAFLSACVTAAGRSPFGVAQAITSRYTTISCIFTVSALVIASSYVRGCRAAGETAWRRTLLGARIASVLLVMAYMVVSLNGIRQTIRRRAVIQENARCLYDIDSASDECLEALYPDPDILRRKAAVIRELGLSLFADGRFDEHGAAPPE